MKFDVFDELMIASAQLHNCLIRDGYVFTSWNDRPKVYDVLVIREPWNSVGNTRIYPVSNRSLEEHIHLIDEEQIKRAEIIADDISFIRNCPSLEELSISPSHSATDGFDYSPLYEMPNITKLSCDTVYGDKEQFSCTIDYSKLCGLKDVSVYGKGHLNYASAESLEKLWLSNVKNTRNLHHLSQCKQIKELAIIQCGLSALDGIEQLEKLQCLSLWHNRSLSDISCLGSLTESLRSLDIESCAKIKDLSCLHKLTNLEHLELLGSNTLPDLSFLSRMDKLKTFTFSMEVADGDLSPCMGVPYARCAKGRKWYNIKDKDLPKQVPPEPFEII